MSKLIIGIDPGLTGAIATNTGLVWDLPVLAKGTGKQAAITKHLDPKGLYNLFYHIIKQAEDLNQEIVVYLERQYYRKKVNPKTKQEIPQGGSSIFSLGDTYGVCRSMAPIFGIKMETIMPSVWKPKMGITYDKEVCRARAIELYPASYDYLKRKKDHNRAEALLIAKYGEQCEGK